MRTRIKYYKYDNLLQTDWFTVGPNLIIKGVINTTENTYSVIEFDSETISKSEAKDLRSAKSGLRKTLSSLGVKFGEEIKVVT